MHEPRGDRPAPPNDEGRPQGRAALQVGQTTNSTVQRPPEVIEAMRLVLEGLDLRDAEVTAAYRDGYRDGFESGSEVGYGRRCVEEAAEWRGHKTLIHRFAGYPEHSARVALDAAYAAGVPCMTRHAAGCARCTRAAAVERRGGDYPGGAVEWEPRRRVQGAA